MYMPLDHDEFITHIASQFRQKFNFRVNEVGLSVRLISQSQYGHVSADRDSLKLTTNKGRTSVFGWHADSLDTIIPVPRDNTRVFFNVWDHPDGGLYVEHLGLERLPTHQTDSKVPPKLPTAMGKIPTPWSARVLIRTACSLDGISKIQPCVKQGVVPRIIGLKVNYRMAIGNAWDRFALT
jgi:hypothetical protein